MNNYPQAIEILKEVFLKSTTLDLLAEIAKHQPAALIKAHKSLKSKLGLSEDDKTNINYIYQTKGKVEAIKEVRQLTSWDLKKCRDYVIAYCENS